MLERGSDDWVAVEVNGVFGDKVRFGVLGFLTRVVILSDLGVFGVVVLYCLQSMGSGL